MLLRTIRGGVNSHLTSSSGSSPLIVHVEDPDRWFSVAYEPTGCFDFSCTLCYGGGGIHSQGSLPYGRTILKRLTEALKLDGTTNFLLMPSHRLGSDGGKTVLSAPGINPFPKAIQVAPVRSPTQQALLQNEDWDMQYNHKKNARLLTRSVRERVSNPWNIAQIQPYVQWWSLGKSTESNQLGQSLLSSEEILELAEEFGQDIEKTHIVRVIGDFFLRRRLLEKWMPTATGKWSNFRPKTRAVIQNNKNNPSKFEWEQKMLNCLVSPGMSQLHVTTIALRGIDSVESSWADIEVDVESKAILLQTYRPFDQEYSKHVWNSQEGLNRRSFALWPAGYWKDASGACSGP
jgi:hypothetical protein